MKNKKQSDDAPDAGPRKKAKMSEDSTSKSAKPAKKPKLSQNATTETATTQNKKFDKKSKFAAGPGNKSKTGKPPYDKVKNAKGALQEKPADWNAFKKEKKELRLKRKSTRSLIEVITRAKQIGEKIRLKTIEGAERTKLINELHELMGNQGNYVKFVLSHDMARIIQYMLKFGPAPVREEISTEIIPSTILMIQSKYGKFVVKGMLKYGNNQIRSNCIKTFYGNAVKLTSHAVSAPIFEFAYSEYASPADKINLIQEFFSDMYRQTKDATVKHLRDVYKDSTDLKTAALGATKANLNRILNKGLLDSGLVQSVLAQFLSECTVEDRTEMIAQLAAHIVVLSNSKDGARAAMTCFWHGTNKDRKTAMKAMKEHIIDMSKHEHAHTAIICLLDTADDTVLLKKTILAEIIKKSVELVSDDWGRRVLAWIVAPADRTQFHPQFIRELEEGRTASACKKEAGTRRAEILDHCIKPLLDAIAEDAKTWCLDGKRMLVTSLILRNETAMEIAGGAFQSIAQIVTDLEFKVDEQLFVENSGVSMSIKKLLHNDKNILGDETFGSAIVALLTDTQITCWVAFNRGCFLLADIYSNSKAPVQGQLKALLKPHVKLIKELNTKGAEILLSKLS